MTAATSSELRAIWGGAIRASSMIPRCLSEALKAPSADAPKLIRDKLPT